jgi:dTDP-4-dehydrorhamnose 3,5-epimerase
LKVAQTRVPGVFLIGLELIEDERGFFARTWCAEEFRRHQLNPDLAQCSVSFNRHRGTLRGMHYQVEPWAETKLVRCTSGAIYDVALDLRPDSPAYRQWVGVELTSRNRLGLYIPEGVAHGFQTLAEDSEVFYQISVPYHPESGRGVRWNDPAFGIRWPLAEPLLNERDDSYPLQI